MRSPSAQRCAGWPAFLAAFLAFLVAIAGEGSAEPRVERRAVDAQIVPGVARAGGASVAALPSRGPTERDRRIRALIPDAGRNCLDVDAAPVTAAQRELAAAIEAVRRSETGARLVAIAAARRVTVCLDRSTELEAHYRSYLGLLGLNVRLDPAGRIVFLAHELAHVPQHPRFSNDRQFSPMDMLLLQRAREAAAEAVATQVLWQLRELGIEAPWWSKLTTAYRDIAEAFEDGMSVDRLGAGEGEAARSAFFRWFDADWRLDIYDELMLKTLARIAADRIGLVPTSRHLSDGYLRDVAGHAGESFLREGDGALLLERYRIETLSAASQARLETILGSAAGDAAQPKLTVAGEPLSSVSEPAEAAGSDPRNDG